jgi:membrane-bound ClpP family serine protease
VLVEGEIWSAVATVPVPAGAPLRVVSLENYLLRVEPATPQKPPQDLV